MPFGNEPFEERRRFPIVPEPFPVLMYARQHGRQADRICVEHWSASIAGESEPVTVDDVDVAGAHRIALLENPRAFVRERRHDSGENLIVWDGAPDDASLGGLLGCQLVDERIGNPRAAARLVFVPAGARLLAVTAHFEQPIGNRRLRTFGAALAKRGEIL